MSLISGAVIRRQNDRSGDVNEIDAMALGLTEVFLWVVIILGVLMVLQHADDDV